MSDQKRVRTFVEENDLGGGPGEWLHDLQSELGEVAKEQLKATEYGAKDAEYSEEMELELGDLYFSLLGLANALGININDALEKVLEKYGERIGETDDAGSGN